MADFNGFKSKFLGLIGAAAGKTRDAAGKAADKAKIYARIAKLSVEINGERDTMKKAYIEIGKLYYDSHKDDPDGFFSQLFEEVRLAAENIAQKQTEISALKAAAGDGADENDAAADVSFETVEEDAPETDDGDDSAE